MPATDLIFCLFRVKTSKLSTAERIILEAKCLTIIYYEFQSMIADRYKNYLRLVKPANYMEKQMQGGDFLRELIVDILSTEEYSMAGIARFAHVSEDVLIDIASGLNRHPTFDLSRKIIEIHASVRRDLYDSIVKKAFSDLFGECS
jgi:hypothetical protein